MIDGASRHFDAQPSPSTIEATVTLMRQQWRVGVALVVIASLLEALAFGLLYADTIGARSVGASIASISLFVAVESQASPTDVDALGPLLSATPGIADAVLRPKDDALKALIVKGMPPPDGRNPLPDVWVVHLEPSTFFERDGRTVAAAVSDLRRAIGGMPRVDVVTADERWVATVDRLVGRWTGTWRLVRGTGFVVLGVVLACAALLARKALVPSDRRGSTSPRVLALLGSVVGAASSAIAFGGLWIVGNRLNDTASAALQVSWAQAIGDRSFVVAAIVGSVLLLIVVFLAGAQRGNE